jgi:hypothetical protein
LETDHVLNVTAITPTICDLMAIPRPALAYGDALDAVIEAGKLGSGAGRVAKCLIYAPDAIGTRLVFDFNREFEAVRKYAPISVPLRSVVPPKTPVCFASMFSGAMPEVHGVRVYEKPVLSCDTLFDALGRAGRRVAIIAVADSSIDRIFRNRQIDYFSEEYDHQVTERALAVLRDSEHEFVLVYHQEYDDILHATTHRSPKALEAMRHHIHSFSTLAKACARHWKDEAYLIAFAPDHGAHIDITSGKGTHGEDIPEDMEVTHFFGFGRASGGAL